MSSHIQHLRWAKEEKVQGKEHVSLPNFARRFHFVDKDSANSAFLALICSPEIRMSRRVKLCHVFEQFQKNEEESFWTERAVQVNTTITINQTAIAVQTAGTKRAKLAYEQPSPVTEAILLTDESDAEGRSRPPPPPQFEIPSTIQCGVNFRVDDPTRTCREIKRIKDVLGGVPQVPFVPSTDNIGVLSARIKSELNRIQIPGEKYSWVSEHVRTRGLGQATALEVEIDGVPSKVSVRISLDKLQEALGYPNYNTNCGMVNLSITPPSLPTVPQEEVSGVDYPDTDAETHEGQMVIDLEEEDSCVADHQVAEEDEEEEETLILNRRRAAEHGSALILPSGK
ncbi:hypothetical protein BGW42_002937 [Actinomortierella wolfii]|nr:hypothetical protein BGW42_002937 [Actinomortierella wolfii]